MIDAISKNYRLSERIEKATKSETGGFNMCKALEDWERTAKDEGMREGKKEGTITALCRMISGGLTESFIVGLGYTEDEYNTALRRVKELAA